MTEDLREFLNRIMRAIKRLRQQLRRLRERATREAVYTVSEAARRIKKSVWYTRQMCLKGEIAATKVPGEGGGKGGWRIADDEIERFRAMGKRKPLR